ncbi:MAG: hypothetical protein G01um101456_82 [Parcubacteria group bacterium Gr01-1014_56]|nr:MAG: hypothetical protein G01um101456_82 [Parcubacteria group bacterium Gr01-1014_56]
MNNKILIVAGLVVLVGVGAFAYQNQTGTPAAVLQAGEVVMTGTLVCLPHKGDGPQTMECAYGLQTADGKYYSLLHLWDKAPDLNTTQVKAEIVGVLSAPTATEQYDIAGAIEVSSGKEIQ